MQTITIVIVIFLCLIQPCDHLHASLSPGNNWTQMWSLLVPEFWHRFWNIAQVSFPFSLVTTWSPVLIHILGRLWCEVRLLATERKREGYSPLVSDLRSQCPPHISACWQPFGAITCRAVTDLCVTLPCAHWGFFVCSGRSVCSLRTDAG